MMSRKLVRKGNIFKGFVSSKNQSSLWEKLRIRRQEMMSVGYGIEEGYQTCSDPQTGSMDPKASCGSDLDPVGVGQVMLC